MSELRARFANAGRGGNAADRVYELWLLEPGKQEPAVLRVVWHELMAEAWDHAHVRGECFNPPDALWAAEFHRRKAKALQERG